MKAVVQDRYGPPEALEFTDIDTPSIGPDEVLVRVRAAGIDMGVWHLTAGVPYIVRLGTGLRAPRSRDVGTDVAGEVAAVGERVTAIGVGDAVFGFGRGAFAEYAVARQDMVVLKPDHVDFVQAAAVPSSATSALQGFHEAGPVRRGQRVLVIGAGAGSAATPSSWPRRSGPRSPARAAPPRPTWSARSAPTTSSTTPARTSPTATPST